MGNDKKILIIDEAGFSRICSAILEREGYSTCIISDVRHVDFALNDGNFGLVITSYPFGSAFLEELNTVKIPTIVLSDRFNRDLVVALENFDKSLSYCMIKPLDYTKFRDLIRQVMRGDNSGTIHANMGNVIQTELRTKLQAEQ